MRNSNKHTFKGQSRCSHFQAVCYLAHTVKTGNNLLGYPCTTKCPRRRNTGILPGEPIPLGEETPDEYVILLISFFFIKLKK